MGAESERGCGLPGRKLFRGTVQTVPESEVRAAEGFECSVVRLFEALELGVQMLHSVRNLA